MNKNLIVFILLLPLLGSCNKSVSSVETDASVKLYLNDSLRRIVTVDTVKATALNNELLLNGRISFNPEQVAHVYPMFGGTILNVNAEIGDYVKKGEVLAVIRSGEVADYEKQQKEADQQVIRTNRNLEATRDMFRSGMTSERDVIQAVQEATTALAEQKRIREVYSIYHISGESTYDIKTPVSGFVVGKSISRNMQIRPDQGDELFTISGLDDVWVMADVYESDINKVEEGAPVRITTLAYGDKEFSGIIDKVYNMLNNESKTMDVRIKLKNENYMLKPGMFTNVYVQCNVAKEEMPRVNSRAIIFEDGKQYVVCVSENGLLQMKEVEVYKQTKQYCFLQSGIKEGEQILDKNAILVYNALK